MFLNLTVTLGGRGRYGDGPYNSNGGGGANDGGGGGGSGGGKWQLTQHILKQLMDLKLGFTEILFNF